MTYIEEINQLVNISFEDIKRISTKHIPIERKNSAWIGLDHGVKILNTDDELAQYIVAYGNMHKEKIDLALESISHPTQIFTKELTIVDWGCGQGLATICFFDYMRRLGISVDIKKIILIEPSQKALERAIFHLGKYIQIDKISAINKYINDVTSEDLFSDQCLILHFFSNILDIQTVDLEYLSSLISKNVKSEQLFFCVSPQNLGASRIEQFAQLMHITDDDLVKSYNGQLSGRGTINMLVFHIKDTTPQVIKIAYHPLRRRVIKDSPLKRVIKDNNISQNAPFSVRVMQFYKMVLQLERMKSTQVGDCYEYEMHIEENTESIIFNIDIEGNEDFKEVYLDNLLAPWPKNLYFAIEIEFSGQIYRLLQCIYPFEDIKKLDITQSYLAVPLSSFIINPDVAEVLGLDDDYINVIETLISDKDLSLLKLEQILRDTIAPTLKISNKLGVALTSNSAVLSQTNSELQKLQSVPHSLLLNEFLNGDVLQNKIDNILEDSLLEIVPMDNSQRVAVCNALNSRLSVITGPPGTGKTQVILNLIVNALILGKRVLVASKNNKAVENVKDKYDTFDTIGYLLRFGSKEIIANQLIPYLEIISHQIVSGVLTKTIDQHILDEYSKYSSAIIEAHKYLDELILRRDEFKTNKIEIENIESQICRIIEDYNDLHNKLISEYQDILQLKSNIDWIKECKEIKVHINTLQYNVSGIRKLIFKIFQFKQYASTILNHLQTLPDAFIRRIENETRIITTADIKDIQQLIQHCQKQLELIDKILSIDKIFEETEKSYKASLVQKEADLKQREQRQAVCEKQLSILVSKEKQLKQVIELSKLRINQQSKEILHNTILTRFMRSNAASNIIRFKNYLPDRIPFKEQDVAQYIQDTKAFLDIFLINAITNLSIKNAYPLEADLFDLVIIDEASQCDVASALPLIQRTKQLVVIGDPLQLCHITSVNVDEENALKTELGLHNHPLVYYSNRSLWDYCKDLIVTADVNNHRIDLMRHYRSHPQIIGYSNEFFYTKLLTNPLLVSPIDLYPLQHQGIIWEDVKGNQYSDTRNVNELEANRCIELATELAERYSDLKIGIITPFKDQVREIYAKLPSKYRESEQIIVDTVHKFQGDERHVIIYSLVVTDNSPISKINWIDNATPNLVNVAVTRAKTLLYIVGNREYIRTHSCITRPLGFLVQYTEQNATIKQNVDYKSYIIDTNVLIDNPEILHNIDENDIIIIPQKVLDELDRHKCSNDEYLHDNSTKALSNIRKKLNDNVRVESADFSYLPQDLNRKNPDNMILAVALKYRNHNPLFLTSDNALVAKAKGMNIPTQTLHEFNNNINNNFLL